jgi:hypothetical protein
MASSASSAVAEGPCRSTSPLRRASAVRMAWACVISAQQYVWRFAVHTEAIEERQQSKLRPRRRQDTKVRVAGILRAVASGIKVQTSVGHLKRIVDFDSKISMTGSFSKKDQQSRSASGRSVSDPLRSFRRIRVKRLDGGTVTDRCLPIHLPQAAKPHVSVTATLAEARRRRAA